MLEASVVITTRDRADRLGRQLEALRAQTVGAERFEVIVVDDAGGPETAELLERESWARLVRRDRRGGPGAGRNSGVAAARAPLIVFTDDDCVVTPGWLEALLEARERHPGAFLQGRVLPLPEEREAYGPFSHTVHIEDLTRGFETANIAYPREVFERVGGFDETFTASGEDTDLAWKAIEAGYEPVFVADALAHHAVVQLGPRGALERAARWHEAPLAFKRHPGLRATLVHRVFWNRHHWLFARALLALAVPRRLWWLRWWLAAPYVAFLVDRRSGPLLAPYLVARDAVEVATLLRGSARHRFLVI